MDIDFTPDGKSLVSCSRDGTVKLWDIAKKRLVRDLSGHGENTWAVRVSKDGKLVAAGSERGMARKRGKVVVWRRDTGKIVHTLSGQTAAITQLRFTSDGKRLVAGSGHLTQRKGELIIWDVEREQISENSRGRNQRARHIPDDRVIATCGTSGQIHLWDCDSAEYIRVMGQPGEAYYSVAFSDDGKLLAAGGDSSVAIFDVESGSVVEEVRSFRSSEGCVLRQPEPFDQLQPRWFGQVVGCTSGESLLTLRDFAGETYRARMSPDGLTLVCSGDDSRLSLRQLPPRLS